MVSRLCTDLLGIPSYRVAADPSAVMSDKDSAALEAAVRRLLSGEPLQYIVGFTEFFGHRFNVTPAVLIPRPETELMCDMAVRAAAEAFPSGPGSVLDICTGSGCIAWTLASEFPRSHVAAVDISRPALEVADGQDVCANRPDFICADALGDLSVALGERRFDVILSNPPYIRDMERSAMAANVLEHEPPLALFVPDDDPLVFYRAVAANSAALLSPDGFGFVEINEALGPETAGVFRTAGFRDVTLLQDLSSRDRFVRFSGHI